MTAARSKGLTMAASPARLGNRPDCRTNSTRVALLMTRSEIFYRDLESRFELRQSSILTATNCPALRLQLQVKRVHSACCWSVRAWDVEREATAGRRSSTRDACPPWGKTHKGTRGSSESRGASARSRLDLPLLDLTWAHEPEWPTARGSRDSSPPPVAARRT